MTQNIPSAINELAADAHVVLMVNFVAPNLRAVCREIQSRVGRLTILSSVSNESNREWSVDWGDLDVIVQKTWTITRHPKHPSGYREVNYVHVPLDTLSQLRRLRPDAIVSLELGMRTLLSLSYRKMNPTCAHIAAVNASDRSEAGRGRLRLATRRRMLANVDWVTYNGPSCQQVLLSLEADSARMSPWQYAADPSKAYQGPLAESRQEDASTLSLLTIGELSERKGVSQALEQLNQWATARPAHKIIWNLVGSGPLESQLRSTPVSDNLEIQFHGFCSAETIRTHYRCNDMMLFPTLCDEWGLVVDESLLSGLPVVGSCHAQSVTTLVQNGFNGLVFDPSEATDTHQEMSLFAALDKVVGLSSEQFLELRFNARESVASRTPAVSADQFSDAVGRALADRKGMEVGALTPDPATEQTGQQIERQTRDREMLMQEASS